MAEKEKFFEGPVDRTPYGACVWVGVIIGAVFLIGVVTLWRTAGYIKSHKLFQFNLPNVPATDNLIDQVKNAGSTIATPSLPSAEELKAQAQKKAEEAAKAEAERQMNEQIENAKDQLSQ